MGDLLEQAIENQCLIWLKSRGIFGFKVRSVGTYDPRKRVFRTNKWFRKGCPDILCCISGRFIGLEIKTRTGRLSEHQKDFHKDIVAHHGLVYVVRSVDELEGIFNEVSTLQKEHLPCDQGEARQEG